MHLLMLLSCGVEMPHSLLDQAIFGAYEVFANIIPGTVLVTTVILVAGPARILQYVVALPETLLLVLLLFSAFIVGMAIQGLSALLESPINKRRYGGYPSSVYLDDNDRTFPVYFKREFRELVNKQFGTPLETSKHHIFELCYTYVVQKNVSTRVPQFLRTYTFARNMTVTMILEAAICLAWSALRAEIWIALPGLLALGSSYLFYKRFIRYSESFAKEVYRSFFIDKVVPESK